MDVETHGVGGVNPFRDGVEEEQQFQLLVERLHFAFKLPILQDVPSAVIYILRER